MRFNFTVDLTEMQSGRDTLLYWVTSSFLSLFFLRDYRRAGPRFLALLITGCNSERISLLLS